MADPIKRVNYFDHQFLHADDFSDEQKYHISMRQHHNRLLHTWGIARGLDLSFKTGEPSATVSEGVAVDGNGREIVLAESRLTPDLSGYKNKTVYITIVYAEEETNLTNETGVSGNTRVTETPQIRVAEDPPVDPSQELILGRLMLDKNAKINGKDEGEEPHKRRLAGVIGGDLEVRCLRLSLPDAASSQWPALSCGAPGQVSLTGHLTVSGNLGLGTASPQSPLAVSGGAAIGSGYADQKAPDNGLLVEGNVGIGTTSPEATLDVVGVVRAETFASTNPLRHRMYPADPLVYQDIFDALKKEAIAKLGTPQYDEKRWGGTELWNDRHLIKFGSNNEADGNGAVVTIPTDYDTVWVRVLGERWAAIKAYFRDGGQEDLGLWVGGRRCANCYCPDGTLSDGYAGAHQWLPIPTGRAGKLALIAKPHTNGDFWLSGLAFSRNPWAHAAQSAVGYHWALNGGDSTAWLENEYFWNSDLNSAINAKTNLELRVPVVPSGRDKLLYLIECNNNWNGCMHNGITVNDHRIERFMATYDNPFARHWNSKWYNRYIAARIPADLIPTDARWLKVRIDMSKQDNHIHFREIGTHDLDIPTHS
jgi:hypothetical protein